MKIVKTSDKMTPSIKRVIKKLDDVPEQAYKIFVKETPIADGYARDHTRLDKDTIVADYPYAKRLDEGYSRQAPEGMTKPTIDKVKKIVDKIFKDK